MYQGEEEECDGDPDGRRTRVERKRKSFEVVERMKCEEDRSTIFVNRNWKLFRFDLITILVNRNLNHFRYNAIELSIYFAFLNEKFSTSCFVNNLKGSFWCGFTNTIGKTRQNKIYKSLSDYLQIFLLCPIIPIIPTLIIPSEFCSFSFFCNFLSPRLGKVTRIISKLNNNQTE